MVKYIIALLTITSFSNVFAMQTIARSEFHSKSFERDNEENTNEISSLEDSNESGDGYVSEFNNFNSPGFSSYGESIVEYNDENENYVTD